MDNHRMPYNGKLLFATCAGATFIGRGDYSNPCDVFPLWDAFEVEDFASIRVLPMAKGPARVHLRVDFTIEVDEGTPLADAYFKAMERYP